MKLQITIITVLTHCFFFIDIIYREISKKYNQVNRSIGICLHSLSQVLAKARGSNTVNLYTRHFSKWQQWVSQFPNTKAIPADDTYVIAYMLNLFQKNKSYENIRLSFFAIKYFQKITGHENVLTGGLPLLVLEGIKRTSQKISRKKLPLTTEHLHKLYKNFGGKNMNLKDLRTILICIFSFMGFLRYNEVSNLRMSDIVFHDSYMAIFIEKSKTDIYRNGNWLYLAKLKSKLCPITLLRRYMKLAKIDKHSNFYIFRGLCKRSKGFRLRDKDVHISYTTARENVLEALSKIGLNSKKFGLHSLRAGGATAAANLGVSDRLFQKHGRWKSERVKNGYVYENIPVLLQVTKNLGL